MDTETTTNIFAVGIAYIILGVLLRVIIISTMVMIVRSCIFDKKKKAKVTLDIKSESTKLFIGYIAIISFLYFAVIDLTLGFKEDFNSLIWLGLFIVEAAIAVPHLANKLKVKLESKNKTKVKQGA